MKKIFALLLSAVMLFGAAGCGNGKDDGAAKDGTEYTIYMHFSNAYVFDENWPIWKKAAELTGVKLKGTASATVSDSAQSWSTLLVEKKFPDIIHQTTSKLTELGMDGGLVPIEDYIKDCPNIKEFFDKCPEALLAATAADGHVYCVPGSLSGIEEGNLPSEGWFIRTDWLKKLNLDVPKTVDEYYTVLKAFKEQDPNGNGQADEIPFFSRNNGVYSLFQLFGAYSSWYVDEKGNAAFGRIQPEYKDAVREVAKWYKEGIIDKEIYTRGKAAREQLLASNQGGSTYDWFSSTGAFNETYKEAVKDFEFKPMTPPADINGKIKVNTGRSILHNYGWGISKDCKDIEGVMKYFDFWMSEEGHELISYGVEGIHYDVVDGKKVFKDSVLNAKEGVPGYMRTQGQAEIGAIGSIDAELLGMSEIAREGFQEYRENKYVSELFPITSYIEEEQEISDRVESNINTYIKEQEQKWILGEEDVDATWDKYIETLKSMGLDEFVKIKTNSYKRAVGKK